MPLKTQGFQVSALPQAPRIPPQIGKVDIRAIDEGVRRGLQTFEMIRQAPQSMALADATMAAKIAQAPLNTRLALAETEAAEAQLPLKTAILADSASPETLEAKRRALENRYTRPLTGVPFLLTRVAALEQDVIDNPNDPVAVKALADARAQLTQARDIATANIAGRQAVAADTNETKLAVAEAADQRIRDLAASNETMRRELDALRLKSQEERTKMTVNAPPKESEPGLQHSNNLEQAEDVVRSARRALDAASVTGDPDLIATAQDQFDLANIRRENAQRAYTLYHDERKRKTIADKEDPLIAAINARNARNAKPGAKPAPPATAVPEVEWTDLTLPSGAKVKVRKKQ